MPKNPTIMPKIHEATFIVTYWEYEKPENKLGFISVLYVLAREYAIKQVYIRLLKKTEVISAKKRL